MSDAIRFDLETSWLLAAIDRLGPALLRYTKPACFVTATNVAREARSRLQRQLGPNATGQTLAGIHLEDMREGEGYFVISDRHAFPNLPGWIEHGTHRGEPGSHTEPARPYFDVAGRLEEGAHRRRIVDAIDAAAADTGLGSA